MKYYLIVGEASGDLHASRLMQSLKEIDSAAEFRFFGGDMMAAVGGFRVRHYRELAYMGFIPVLLHLPTILGNMRLCKRDITEWQPDCVILVDYPGFNLKIAKYVNRRQISLSIIIYPPRYGPGRNIASRTSSAMWMNSFPSCLSRWSFSKENTIIPSIMWAILRLTR